MKRFAYSVCDIPADAADWRAIERFLCDMGADGRELVSCMPSHDGVRLVFKREAAS